MVVLTFYSCTWEKMAGGSLWVQVHPGLQSEIQVIQDYRLRPYLKIIIITM